MDLLESIATKIEDNNSTRPLTRNTLKVHPIDSTKIPSQTREIIQKLENHIEKPLTLNTMKVHPIKPSTMYQQEYRTNRGGGGTTYTKNYERTESSQSNDFDISVLFT
ncbi:hypothetical protein ACQ4LE_008897 [Meloidogyne hapla]|uniref:Uncharacterized protein n=1 Tax=Meloidogyne hapla TaxID=6305 RepID=A0A1I8BVG9_MELHA